MPPSSNWLALKKNLSYRKQENGRPAKRRKLDTLSEDASSIIESPKIETTRSEHHGSSANRDSVDLLRKMVSGQITYPPAHLLPGKYLAIDCEMVGIAGRPKDPSTPGKSGQDDESSLGRVSVVNYYGAVQLDVFVQQRERVSDWRTQFSGIRASDMINAKPFLEVQKLVSDLLKDRILVGHAVHNDLKVLLLSHPHNMTRDTQVLAGRYGTLSTSKTRETETSPETATVKVVRNRKPPLRKLVSQELGIEIQTGEHSSVIDARATMAIYRLHRKIWDQGFKPVVTPSERKRSRTPSDAVTVAERASLSFDIQGQPTSRKRSLSGLADLGDDTTTDNTGNTNRQPKASSERRPKKKKSRVKSAGHSSGLSVVIKKRQGRVETKHLPTGRRGDSVGKDTKWWKRLS